MFLVEWARYRKQGTLQHPQLVLGVIPTSPHQFDFVLDLHAQIALISVVGTIEDTNIILLADHLVSHPLASIITQHFVTRIVALYSQWFQKEGSTASNQVREFLIGILAKTA